MKLQDPKVDECPRLAASRTQGNLCAAPLGGQRWLPSGRRDASSKEKKRLLGICAISVPDATLHLFAKLSGKDTHSLCGGDRQHVLTLGGDVERGGR